jgi:YHS domain-containing protein
MDLELRTRSCRESLRRAVSGVSPPMASLICPTCGCSLVRLGIAPSAAPSLHFEGSKYDFCCSGCRDIFVTDPERYLRETETLQVCPVCLAEKPVSQTVRVVHGDSVFFFCRCPHCLAEFRRSPDQYIARLEGRVPCAGIFGEGTPCCPPVPAEEAVLVSTITCPKCGHRRVEAMPTDACIHFYECSGCHTTLRPKPGHCCVFCSYGSVPCPSIQQHTSA